METGLKGKTVVITGTAQGIGREIAAGFVANGCHVIGVDVIDQTETGSYVSSVGQEGTWKALAIDLSSVESIQDGCGRILAESPKLDALVNNAALYGGLSMKPMEMTDIEEWDRVQAINVRGPFLMIKELLPGLKEAKGHIINFASVAALKGSPGLTHYVASKGAVLGMTRALATELGQHGITVNAVAPGFVDNEASQHVGGEMFSKYLEGTVGAQAIHEAVQPKDVVGAVLFLASAWADAITGQLLPVDRGLHKN